MSRSYIPPTEAGLSTWSANFVAVLTANPAVYGVSAGDVTNVTGLNTTFQADFLLFGSTNRRANNPATRTQAGVTQLAADRAALLAVVRPMSVTISKSNGISNEAKTALGVTVADSTKSPIPAPVTFPNLTVDIPATGQFQIRYNDSATPNTKAKPVGATQLQIFGAVSATVITDPTTLPLITTVTKNPSLLLTNPADLTKRMYLVGRWITAKGLTGPFGPIITSIVA